jgi:hypothetical protein
MNIYFKENGSKIFEQILFSETDDDNGDVYFPNHAGKSFYFQEHDKYIAVDNSDCDCWVEEFDSEADAIRWLKEV